jgi:hypothetical protein
MIPSLHPDYEQLKKTFLSSILGATTLSIMTLSKMTLSITDYTQYNGIQHNNTCLSELSITTLSRMTTSVTKKCSTMCHYLSIKVSVIKLNVTALILYNGMVS